MAVESSFSLSVLLMHTVHAYRIIKFVCQDEVADCLMKLSKSQPFLRVRIPTASHEFVPAELNLAHSDVYYSGTWTIRTPPRYMKCPY